jgi:hypothetical protein
MPVTTSEELLLIRQAARALGEQQPALALQMLERHAERFPHGSLQQERAGMLVIVLCQQGRFAEAEPLRERFLAEVPHSPVAARIMRACRH